MQMITIDKNVPMPERQRYNVWGNLVSKLEIGDSVLLTSQKKADSFASYMSSHGKRTSRRMNADREYRVWYVGDK